MLPPPLKCLNNAVILRRFIQLPVQYRRRHALYSTLPSPKVVSVRTGMAGHVNLSLYNISDANPRDPVLIYLPSHGDTGTDLAVPPYLHDVPLAVIHYRWSGKKCSFGAVNSPMHWPTPIFDVSFAWEWLAEHLKPAGEYARRDFFVFGTHLGAPLAVTLAMTNCWPHVGVAIRGVAAYDGVYDWTRFLPDHWDNRLSGNTPIAGSKSKYGGKNNAVQKRSIPTPPPPLDHYKSRLKELFKTPENLFDSSASPFLLFATSGLKVPQTFDKTLREEYDELHIPAIAESEEEALERLRQEHAELHGYIDISHDEKRYALAPDPDDLSHFLRRLAAKARAPAPVHLNFPSWSSQLAIPDALLMYTASAAERLTPDGPPDNTIYGVQMDLASGSDVPLNGAAGPDTKSWRVRKPLALPHTSKTHAVMLGREMVRSVQMFEAEPRSRQNDPDFGAYMRRQKTRIIAADVGEHQGFTLTDKGVEMFLDWLGPRLKRARDYFGCVDDEGTKLQEELEMVAGRDYWDIHSEDDVDSANLADHEDLVAEEHPRPLDEYPGEVEYDQFDELDPIMSEEEVEYRDELE